jgi:outer membrane protein
MKAGTILATLSLLGVGLLSYFFFTKNQKVGFIYNNQVFAKFEGTVHLDKKIKKEKDAHRKTLDSLSLLIQGGRKDLSDSYAVYVNNFSAAESQQSEQYTADIWKFLNEAIKEFGDKNGYDLIVGATGDGSLMYAREGLDLTDEVVGYANTKYKDNPVK